MGYPGNQHNHARKWTEDRIETGRRLLAAGLSYSLAAARFGCTKGQLIGAMWRAAGNRDARDTFVPTETIKDHWFEGGCRWVLGEPSRDGYTPGNWRWCGKKTEPGHTWCREHEKIGWYGGQPHPLTIAGRS